MPARPPRRPRAAACALAALAVTTLAACGDSVAVLGDSITVVSDTQLNYEAGWDYDLDVSAVLGIQTGPMVEQARKMAGDDPTQVVVNLGSNDVLRDVDLNQSAANLKAIVDSFPEARCIHLVDINTHMKDNGRPVGRRADIMNAAIRRIADLEDPQNRVSVIEWNRAVGEDLLANPPNGTLLADTVHPTPAGRAKLADLVRAALDACPNP